LFHGKPVDGSGTEVIAMRKFLISGAIVAAALLLAGPSQAQGAWCAVLNFGIGVQENCSFRSFEVCQSEARHFGSSSFCRPSGYGGLSAAPRVHRKAHRTKRHRHHRTR
jgi:hypothetical protein